MLHTILIVIAVLAFLAIALEDVVHLNKAKSTLFFGTLSWILLFLFEADPEKIQPLFAENVLDVAQLWLFLVAAMTFVAYLNQHGMVENLVYKMLPANMPQKALLPFVALFAFVFSSFCDNITTTLVTVALIQSLKLPVEKNIKLAVLAVFGINSGGAALITGDVTTLMIFNAGKVGISDLFAIIPAGLISCLVLSVLFMPGFEGKLIIERNTIQSTTFDKLVAFIFIVTILATLGFNLFAYMPPLLVFLFGISLVFMFARVMNYEDETPIIDYIRKIEFDTLLFFLGVLLIVGMLKEIGTLQLITSLYGQYAPNIANFLIGCFSAVIDNVPLTAAVLKSDLTMPLNDWLGFTYAVGVGGSLLAIGSAAGVLVMSKVPGVTFLSYLKYTPHLLVSFAIGYAIIVFF
jgi:Na+/H+ antiporter NhaD/arsenite permease-like protein